MPLRPDQYQRIAEALNLKTQFTQGGPGCSLCGHHNWIIGDGFISLPIIDNPMNMQFGGPHYPNIPIICRTCGNTLLVNLRVLGLIEVAEGRDVPPPPNAPPQINLQQLGSPPSPIKKD